MNADWWEYRSRLTNNKCISKISYKLYQRVLKQLWYRLYSHKRKWWHLRIDKLFLDIVVGLCKIQFSTILCRAPIYSAPFNVIRSVEISCFDRSPCGTFKRGPCDFYIKLGNPVVIRGVFIAPEERISNWRIGQSKWTFAGKRTGD